MLYYIHITRRLQYIFYIHASMFKIRKHITKGSRGLPSAIPALAPTARSRPPVFPEKQKTDKERVSQTFVSLHLFWFVTRLYLPLVRSMDLMLTQKTVRCWATVALQNHRSNTAVGLFQKLQFLKTNQYWTA